MDYSQLEGLLGGPSQDEKRQMATDALLTFGLTTLANNNNRKNGMQAIGMGGLAGMQALQQGKRDLMGEKLQQFKISQMIDEVKAKQSQQQAQSDLLGQVQDPKMKALFQAYPQLVPEYMKPKGPSELKEIKNLSVGGKVVPVSVFKDGTVRTMDGYDVPPDIVLQNTGDRLTAIDKNNLRGGESMSMGVSPDARLSASTTMRGQNMTDARGRESNQISAVTAGLNQQRLASELKDKETSKQGAVAAYDTAIGTLDRLASHPGLDASVGLKGASSAFGLINVPGTDSANFNAELESFKSQAFLPMVQQLRGMGALSNAEGEKLTAAVGALSPSMSEKEFRASINRIKMDLSLAKARANNSSAPAQGAVIDFSQLK